MHITSDDNATLTIGRAQRDAITRVERMLMAPCCYTQTIDVHASDIADKMRAHVRSMTLDGKSEQDIFEYYKSRYGEQILAVPDGTLGQLAFGIPLAVTVVATGALLLALRRFHSRKLTIALSASVTMSDVSEAVREEIRRQTAW